MNPGPVQEAEIHIPCDDEVFDPVCSQDDIYYCFRLILGRNPSREEWDGHSSLSGNQLRGVVRNYLGSREFAEHRMFDGARTDSVALARHDGFVVYADKDDLAVGQYVAAGDYEADVANVLRDVLRPGMHVIDIGANIGYFSMMAASLVGPTGTVLAIEPNPNNVKMIESSRRANAFEQVTVIASGVGDRLGLLQLETSFSNGVTSPVGSAFGEVMSSTVVPCMPLSRMLTPGQPIDFIKIDVEGAEFSVLSTALELLVRWRPTVVTEFSPRLLRINSGVSGADYLNLFLQAGYTATIVEHPRKTGPFGIDAIMNHLQSVGGDHIDLLLTPGALPAGRKGWRRFLRR